MRHIIIQSDAAHIPLADSSVDLTFTSPPYADARYYEDKDQHARDCEEWIEWMLPIISECCRVTKGLVLVNCAGVTRDWCYWPGPEGLLYRWWQSGGRCWRPAYWHRVGIPGSGHEQWLRADVEYVLAFTRCEKQVPWADNVANGHPPKWAPGGEMAHRLSDGTRVNQRGHPIDSGGTEGSIDGVTCGAARPSHRKMTPFGPAPTKANNRANGKDQKRTWFNGKRSMGGKIHTKRNTGANKDALTEQCYLPPDLANPGNLFHCKVGGGHMGHSLAHDGDAPFPVALPAWFIRSHCPPNGWVLDPFGGTGSTAQAAVENGRNAIVCDIRASQIRIMQERLMHLQPPLFA